MKNYSQPNHQTIDELEKEGKILIIFFNDESKEALKSKTAEISSAKLSDFVEQILKSGYNELVIK